MVVVNALSMSKGGRKSSITYIHSYKTLEFRLLNEKHIGLSVQNVLTIKGAFKRYICFLFISIYYCTTMLTVSRPFGKCKAVNQHPNSYASNFFHGQKPDFIELTLTGTHWTRYKWDNHSLWKNKLWILSWKETTMSEYCQYIDIIIEERLNSKNDFI